MLYFNLLASQTKSPTAHLNTISASGSLWGAFVGLFGLDNNQLITLTTEPLATPENMTRIRSESMAPTARPRDYTPLSKDGLYVFREFDLAAENIDRLVALSVEAWTTFETDAEFQTEPVALLRQETPLANTTMTLITWYDGFESWQRSRQPNPAAMENFQQRAALTTATRAIATRLVRD